jgi:FKBP-type peptidyl-prolyl cis-trans isomerase 2
MQTTFVSLFLIALVLLSGCAQSPPQGNGSSETIVAAGDTVSVEYEGKLQDGTVFDSSEKAGKPFSFTVGAQQAIQGFDAAVIGMQEGQEKTVTIPPEKAYGQYDNTKLVELPKSQFADPDKMVVGLPIHSETGVNGVIKEIKNDSIVVDFNHPLAGKTLIFWIKVVKIVKA